MSESVPPRGGLLGKVKGNAPAHISGAAVSALSGIVGHERQTVQMTSFSRPHDNALGANPAATIPYQRRTLFGGDYL
jgi:hypothetical protein